MNVRFQSYFFRWLRHGFVCLPLVFLAGCGGGGGQAPGANTTRSGKLVLNIKWPDATPTKAQTAPQGSARLHHAGAAAQQRGVPPGSGEGIPFGTVAIVVAVNDLNTGASLAAPITVLAPRNGFGQTQMVQFTNLPLSLVRVTANAYPDAAALQLPLATGSATGQVIADVNTPITVPLALNAATLEANPPAITLQPSQGNSSATLDIVVRNGAGQPVNFPLLVSGYDPVVVSVTPDPAVPGRYTVAAANPGTTSPQSTFIFIREPNSNLTATVSVTVNP